MTISRRDLLKAGYNLIAGASIIYTGYSAIGSLLHNDGQQNKTVEYELDHTQVKALLDEIGYKQLSEKFALPPSYAKGEMDLVSGSMWLKDEYIPVFKFRLRLHIGPQERDVLLMGEIHAPNKVYNMLICRGHDSCLVSVNSEMKEYRQEMEEMARKLWEHEIAPLVQSGEL